MLPSFDEAGYLPEGIHRVSEEDVFSRFATGSARRKWLGESLREILRLAKATGKLERAFIFGSFVTAVESPNDLDLILVVAPDFKLEALTQEYRDVFDYGRARVRFTADIFWTKSSIGSQVLKLWLDTYQMTREYRNRGIVEVIL
jgi:hypothetical protein